MRTRMMPAFLVGALGFALVGCGNGSDDATDDIVVASGADHYPNTTASDWVTYADHVVVVTAISDRALPPDEEDEANAEGYLHRKATLRVDEVVWSRAEPVQPAPTGSFEWDAWGWAAQDGEQLPMAGEDEPRVEVGHTYIMALAWEPTLDDGDDFVPAHWIGLGADAVIPYDAGIIGRGEFAGRQQDEAIPLDSTDPNYSLEDEMAGQNVDALAAALDSAVPGERLDY